MSTSKPRRPPRTLDARLAAVGNPMRDPSSGSCCNSSQALSLFLLFYFTPTGLQLQLLKASFQPAGVGRGWGGGPKQEKVPWRPHCSKGSFPQPILGMCIPQRKWAVVHRSGLDREFVSWPSQLFPPFFRISPVLPSCFIPWELIPEKPPGPKSSLQSCL